MVDLRNIACDALECCSEQLKQRKYTICDFPVYYVTGTSAVITTKEQIMDYLINDVLESIYCVNPEIVATYVDGVGATKWMLRAIEDLQEGGRYANPTLRLLVSADEDAFANHVIETDSSRCGIFGLMSEAINRELEDQGLSKLFDISSKYDTTEIGFGDETYICFLIVDSE